MTIKVDLVVSFSSQSPLVLTQSFNKLKYFNYEPPTLITTVTSQGFTEFEGSSNWIDKWVSKADKHDVTAYWGTIFKHKGFIIYNPKEQVVTIKINNFEFIDERNMIEMFAPLPWTVANFYQITRQEGWKRYRAPGFANGHGGHGWACAFKGEGHNRLVSRRWLEYNPWHLIRDEEHDISFVQFHDLEAEPAKALEQAKPGHRATSIRGIGGFINKTHPFSTHPQGIYFGEELRGIYVHDTQNLRVVIPAGKPVDYYDMYNYCAAKYYQICAEGLIKTISFVFIVAAEAEPHLYDLWLRNIECFGFTEQGEEIRLDEDYQPTYEHPEWVKQLRQKQQQQSLQAKLDKVTTRLSQINTEMKRLDDRIRNLSGGSFDRALHTRIKELKAQLSKLIGEKNKLEREKTDLEQEIDQANL